MPWKDLSTSGERARFVKAALARVDSFITLCRRFGIVRTTGYLWLARFAAAGVSGLADRHSGRPGGQKGRRRQRWEKRLLEVRKKHRSWGPKKLRADLQRTYRCARLPSERTVARLLAAAGWIGRRKQRSRPGPQLAQPKRSAARRCNTEWTVDFKGHFRTGDGELCRPLTIRDLFSRYLLVCAHVAQPSEAAVRAVMTQCFRRYGLPRVIRVDNGAPFAGVGALGLSALSVWWMRLGITVAFTRRGKPQDNGAHEQMHRVLKQKIARPPAPTLRAQTARLRDFCRYYNRERPHEALGQRVPGEIYRCSSRAYAEAEELCYPSSWSTRRVSSGGYLKWGGQTRHVGRAFAHERVGLKPRKAGGGDSGKEVVEVFLGHQLIGEIHRDDRAGMRPAQWRKHPDAPAK